MAYGSFTIKDAAGSAVAMARDLISSVNFERVKMAWGVQGVATDVSYTDPLPVSDGMTQIVEKSAPTDLTTAVVSLPEIPLTADLYGVTATVHVEVGTMRWGVVGLTTPSSTDGDPVPAGGSIALNIGLQLEDVRIVGASTATIHVTYSKAGEVAA